MNREIKFRGKKKYSNEWVYGYFVFTYNCCYIINNEYISIPEEDPSKYFIEVEPKTVSQHIGLKDKNQKDIYQGDSVSFDGLKGKVRFSEQIPGWYIEYQQPPLRAIYTRRFNCAYGDGQNYIDGTIELISE